MSLPPKEKHMTQGQLAIAGCSGSLEQKKEVTYDANGDYTVSPDEGKVLSEVKVKVAVE